MLVSAMAQPRPFWSALSWIQRPVVVTTSSRCSACERLHPDQARAHELCWAVGGGGPGCSPARPGVEAVEPRPNVGAHRRRRSVRTAVSETTLRAAWSLNEARRIKTIRRASAYPAGPRHVHRRRPFPSQPLTGRRATGEWRRSQTAECSSTFRALTFVPRLDANARARPMTRATRWSDGSTFPLRVGCVDYASGGGVLGRTGHRPIRRSAAAPPSGRQAAER